MVEEKIDNKFPPFAVATYSLIAPKIMKKRIEKETENELFIQRKALQRSRKL